ncbi:MAG TPA: glycosyltransferase, partial [Burkholderiaceae bacterium]|nr:glycosyltransferase [Burkholderiaceae bacterium]
WMSFPMPEADLARARSNAEPRLRRLALWLRGHATVRLLYRFVVPQAARVFVQSGRMGEVVAGRSGRSGGLVAIPMGVDEAEMAAGQPAQRARCAGDPFRIVYLGSMDRIRRIDFLLEVLHELMRRDPQRGYRLVLIGGASTPEEFEWLGQRVQEFQLAGFVELTGPLPRGDAWRLAGGCDLGVSAIPRGEVFDVSSPTKTLEYLAIGLPVLVNDIPDQAQILGRVGGAGLCRPMQVDGFADAILQIRADYANFAAAAAESRAWLQAARGYDVLAGHVAATLREALPAGR